MSDHTTQTISFTLPVLSILQVIFITLKITHVLDWSWYKVLLPAFFEGGLIFLLIVAIFVFAALKAIAVHDD